MNPVVFIDASISIYAAGGDHPYTTLLRRTVINSRMTLHRKAVLLTLCRTVR